MSHAMNDVRKQKKASHGVGSGELVSLRDREPEDGQTVEVKLRSGTRYEAIWTSFGGVSGFALNMTRRRVARKTSPVTHWRPLANTPLTDAQRSV